MKPDWQEFLESGEGYVPEMEILKTIHADYITSSVLCDLYEILERPGYSVGKLYANRDTLRGVTGAVFAAEGRLWGAKFTEKEDLEDGVILITGGISERVGAKLVLNPRV